MSTPGYQVSRDPTAVIGTRIAAWVVDALLLFVLFLALGPTPLSPLAEYSKVPDGMDQTEACEQIRDNADNVSNCLLIGDRVYFTDGSDTAIYTLVSVMYFVIVYVAWQGATGLTPGKLLFGLRAVAEDGRPPGPLKAFVRSILWIVDGLPCIPLVGFIVALTSTGHRRVGDMAAKTFVVGKADAGRPIVVPGMTTAATYGTPGVYGGTPGYPSQVPGSAPWGAGAPGPQAPGASPWGAPPPQGPQPPYAPGPADRPAPPWGTAAPSDAISGGYAAPAAPPPTAPTQPAGPPDPGPTMPMPDAGSFGESSDPADADAGGDLPGGEAPSSGDAPAAEAAEGADSDSTGTGPTDLEGASEEPAATTPESDSTASDAGGATDPGAGAQPGASAPTAPATAGAGDQYNPQWDAARGAYIQWDPNRSRWLQWDDATKEWKPI